MSQGGVGETCTGGSRTGSFYSENFEVRSTTISNFGIGGRDQVAENDPKRWALLKKRQGKPNGLYRRSFQIWKRGGCISCHKNGRPGKKQ